MNYKIGLGLACALLASVAVLAAEEPDPAAPQHDPAPVPQGMTGAKLEAIIRSIDPDSEMQESMWRFHFQEQPMILVFDENADRMRLFTPIGPESLLEPGLMRRMLQANFDSALDARYAVANKVIWGIFIHPLSPLDEKQIASAIIQVFNVAKSFGGTFSSGIFTYGGGDSQEENRKLIEELRKRINPTT